MREFVGSFKNFQTIGRNGLHRYNNQDHAMLTGMLAVRNTVLGEHNDLWSVNTDQEYLEEMPIDPVLDVPDLAEALQGALSQVFPKLDRLAFGLSLGTVSGTILFIATVMLVLKGGETIGPNLQLLNQYFPGYTVTLWGSFLALGYGFATGFAGGWGFAFLRNMSVFLYMAAAHRRAEYQLMRNLLNYF